MLRKTRGLRAVGVCFAAVVLLSGCSGQEVSATAVEQSVREGMATQGVVLHSVSCPEGLAAELDATVVCAVELRDEFALGHPVDRVRVEVSAVDGEQLKYRLVPLAVGAPDDAEATTGNRR